MLIEFRIANFRSFRELQTLSMTSGAGSEFRESNTFDPALGDFPRLLRSAAIYGPNAAGKTNLLRALQFMQSFVLNSASTSASILHPHSPFQFSSECRSKPTRFEISFAQEGVRYEYSFELASDGVHGERLVEYRHARGRAVFSRNRDTYKFGSYLRGPKEVWKDTTRPDALFLSTAVQLNSRQLRPVFDWFQRKLVVVAGATGMNQALTLKLLSEEDGKERLLPFLRVADPGISDLEIQREPLAAGMIAMGPGIMLEKQPGAAVPSAVRVTFSHQGGDSDSPPLALKLDEESGGAQMLFSSAGAWLNVLANGEVLCFDELDASLHALLIRFLVQQFHSDHSNPRNAQLVFSTHNTTLLSQDMFRRDQIWFVERQPDYSSALYPLTEFSPRNDEALERGYLRGRYGALPLFSVELE
jgi:hypothetical protein